MRHGHGKVNSACGLESNISKMTEDRDAWCLVPKNHQ